MNLIRLSIERPVAIIAAVIMVLMFGMIALFTIPIQLTPDVRKPIISLQTLWHGAAPAEIEREITNRQEDVLKGLEGLEEITSQSEDGRSKIKLEFKLGQNMDKAMLLVANRLDRVESYPDEAKRPTINTSSSEDNPITWIVLRRTEGNTRAIHTYGDFVEDVVKERLERVPGVSRVNRYGGGEREMEIIVDPSMMARYRLTVTEVVGRLRAANASISAGDVDEGKRRYVVRTEGEFNNLDDVRNVVLRSEQEDGTGNIARVTVGDIATVQFTYKEATAKIRFLGQPAIAINAIRETGSNVIEVMDGIRDALNELNKNELPQAGLYLTQVYDETVYINSSIDLVQQNIFIGGTLAALMLLLFLRSASATLVVSLAIPVSIIGSFVAMTALGRSLNVISLAGIAFAVGMVVDAAIVVLENIYRLREKGHSSSEAAYLGAKQVWGAVFVSSMTTVLVFIPILVMELEVGQLFRDIAVAISVAVTLSLIVAITVIPALANRFLKDPKRDDRKHVTIPFVDTFSKQFVDFVLTTTKRFTKTRQTALLVVGLITAVTSISSVISLPKMEYLPSGNRNLVFGFILPPPGYNLETMGKIATRIEDSIRHLWVGNGSNELTDEQKHWESEEGHPAIQRFFFVASRANTFMGAAAADGSRVKELIPVLKNEAFKEPGTFGLITQRSLFGRGIGGSRSIELNISGPSLETILNVALRAVGRIEQVLPREGGTQMRPRPGLELGAPEVRILPDRLKLADNGITARELGDTIDAFNDGLRVAEITVDGKRIDLFLRGPDKDEETTQGIDFLPVVTTSGHIVPASSLAKIEVTSGPTEIRHLERLRTVTLEIRPPEEIALESALETIKDGVIKTLEDDGLPDGIKFSLTGTADKLTVTWEAMRIMLAVSTVIVFLVMAVLFESFLYPLIIMLSVPLATAGGIAGLALLNVFIYQPLDMLTLLGFVILIGIVVNNAILLVHQSLIHIREDEMDYKEAIYEATRNRIRPIFMSTLTSIFGMLPLVLFPGAGSELYRGLGSVVLGGLSLSAILTLAIVPPMMALVAGTVESKRHERLMKRIGSAAE